jgi:hypothetical protein
MSSPNDVSWITYGDDYSVADRYPVMTGVAVVVLAAVTMFGVSYAVSSGSAKRAYRRLTR